MVGSKTKEEAVIIQKMNHGKPMPQHEELTLAILRHAEMIESQKSLAKNLGYSVGKINYVIKALVEKGLLKCERFASSSNKAKYNYLLTEEGMKEKMYLTQKFICLKKAEYEELQQELRMIKTKSNKECIG